MASYKVPYTIARGAHSFCPGCGHGVFVRILHEVMLEKGLDQKNVCLVGVGCSSQYNRICGGTNNVECFHGRAPSTARGMKAVANDIFCWTYQGDGDAYSIGMGETMLSAHSGIPITVFVINNCNYGMTGGQTATTTLHGQVTTTSVNGFEGYPFDAMPHMQKESMVGYAARGTTATLAECRKLKKYISNAVDAQMVHKKYAIVEILSPCPTNWHKSPAKAAEWVMNDVASVLPLGEFVNNLK